MVCNFTPPTHTPTIDHMLIKREGYPNRKKSRSLNKKNTHTTTHTNGSHEVILTSCHDVRKENLASSLLPHWDIFEIANISTTPPPSPPPFVSFLKGFLFLSVSVFVPRDGVRFGTKKI